MYEVCSSSLLSPVHVHHENNGLSYTHIHINTHTRTRQPLDYIVMYHRPWQSSKTNVISPLFPVSSSIIYHRLNETLRGGCYQRRYYEGKKKIILHLHFLKRADSGYRWRIKVERLPSINYIKDYRFFSHHYVVAWFLALLWFLILTSRLEKGSSTLVPKVSK